MLAYARLSRVTIKSLQHASQLSDNTSATDFPCYMFISVAILQKAVLVIVNLTCFNSLHAEIISMFQFGNMEIVYNQHCQV